MTSEGESEKYPKWLINARDENNVIVFILQHFNAHDPDEIYEARELYQRYHQLQAKLKANKKEYPISYDELSWLVGDDLSFRKDRLKAIRDNNCKLCGTKAGPILEIHHIRPREIGGNEKDTNLMLLCPNCHKFVHFCMKDPTKVGMVLDVWPVDAGSLQALVNAGQIEAYIKYVSPVEIEIPIES
jgi:predicted restriction endonuclease